MKLEIEIKNCSKCRHRDHSGTFTKGGAYPICGHSDSCKVRDCNFSNEKHHWRHRILPNDDRKYTGEIPKWCPLKKGSNY